MLVIRCHCNAYLCGKRRSVQAWSGSCHIVCASRLKTLDGGKHLSSSCAQGLAAVEGLRMWHAQRSLDSAVETGEPCHYLEVVSAESGATMHDDAYTMHDAS